MNKLIIVFALLISNYSFLAAQTTQVDLAQSVGVFAETSLALEAGSYQFNISNTNVDHEVGFVLVPKGKYDPANHIKEAYVTAPVSTGSSSLSKVVELEAGAYEYFCPMNPTPKYSLVVHDKVEKIQFNQAPGIFTNNNVTITEGVYQFEVLNDGVDHKVGFVLVPKGKYDPTNHIKEAYVKAPVATGSSSMTNIIDLKAGEYEYFCPLNPTPKYTLTVSK